jgi:hypothetical protein
MPSPKVTPGIYATPRLRGLPYQPIKLLDASTKDKNGREVRLRETDVVRLRNGKTVKGLDLLNSTNALEKRLNAYGYTLRQDTTVPQSPKNLVGVAKGQSDFDSLRRNFSARPPSVAINGLPYDVYVRRSYLADNSNLSNSGGEFQGPGVVTSAKQFRKLVSTYHAGQSYGASAGDFGYSGSYSLDFSGTADANGNAYKESLTELNARASGDFGVTYFGNTSSLIHADAAYSGSDKTGQVALSANVGIFGENVYEFSKSFQVGYSDGDKWSESFDWPALDLQVPLGPFTASVQAGVEGSAGITYSYKLSTSSIHGSLQPFVTSDAYFKLSYGVGDDLAGADVGVEGHLTLFDDTITISADAGIYLNEGRDGIRNVDNGLFFSLGLDIENQIHALDGSVDAFAEGHLGFFSHTWRRELFKSSGVSGQQTIFNKTYNYPLSWH